MPPTSRGPREPAPSPAVASAHPGAFDNRTILYVWIAGLFVTCLLLANILGVKVFRFEIPVGEKLLPVEHTVGMLTFPITFVLTDLLNEFYGKRATRRVTYVGFAMGLIAFGLIYAARKFPILPGIPGTATHEAFENIFGAAALMYLASVTAFLASSLLDIFIFGVFKRATGGRLVWLRATGSTVVSQLLDSFAVTVIFFQVLQTLTGGTASPMGFVLRTALTGYVLKFVIAVVLTPVIYAGRYAIREGLGLRPVPADSPDA